MGGHGKKKKKKGLNDRIDKWLRTTLWIWLPFYAFFALIHEMGEHKKHH
jgi:hypothetical protein